jgi:hypothetical protein
LFARPLSATSLKLLLRDPIRYVWQYALGWQQPEQADEPLSLDAMAFGNIVHNALQMAVDALEAGNGLGRASVRQIEAAIGKAVNMVAKSWEAEQPVPPPVIWKRTLQLAKEMSAKALTYPMDPFPGQTSWTEIPFGRVSAKTARSNLPWDSTLPVEIPGTGLIIQGYIDRLDVSGDKRRARVMIRFRARAPGRFAAIISAPFSLSSIARRSADRSRLAGSNLLPTVLIILSSPHASRDISTAPHRRRASSARGSRTAVEVSGDGWPTPRLSKRLPQIRSAFRPFRSWGDFRRATNL